MPREKDNIVLSDEHNSRGIELADRGWLEEAIKEFKKAIDLDPASAHAHDNLATVYAEKKLYREALTEYLTAIRLEPESATAHYNLACFLSTHGSEMAIAEYKEAIDLDPEYPDAHLNLGLTHADHGQIEEAMKELQTAIELDAADAFPRHELAALHMDEGDYRSAITQLKEVTRLEADNFEAQLDLGICYAQKGFYAEAERAYEKARSLNADDLLLNYNLAALYALWGRPKDALSNLTKAIAIDKAKVTSWLTTDPMFDALKGDTEFEALLTSEYVYIAIALLLVLANGFFVATEFAIVKIRPTALKAMVEEGKPGAAGALRMVTELDGYLSATQFGITLASLGLGWIGEPAFSRILEPLVRRVVPEGAAAEAIVHTASLTIAFAVITFLHIVVGELAPKSLAIQKAEATTLAVALPMRLFYFLFYPGIWFLNGTARRLLKLLGLHSASETHDVHSEEELRVILKGAAAAGTIGESRVQLLERALSMMEKTVRQVLVPRNQVRFLDLDEPLEKNVAEARIFGHTWLPVCRGNLDEIEGVVNVKDVFFLLSRGQLQSLAQVQRPVLFVPETATLEQLLTEFRRRRRQFAIVVDEHGGSSGIVSLADVVAEVVGDVGEMGRKVDEVRTLPGGRLEVPGSTGLDDLQDRLDVTFDVPAEEVTTIGGYLMAKLNRIPRSGDKIAVGEFEVAVEQMDGPRVLLVRIQPRLGQPVTPPAR